MEQRKETRKSADFTFQYHLKEDLQGDRLKDGKVVDLSREGIRFETHERIPVGTRLRLVFQGNNPLGKEASPGEEGIVVWSIQPNPQEARYRVGLKYI